MLSAEDQEARAGRVTASTVAAFLGFHWYSSPSKAWDYHTGALEWVDNDDTLLGELLEPGLVKFGAMKLGWNEYLYPCGTRVSDDLPWAAATPDAMEVNGHVGLQIKNQNFHMLKGYHGPPGTLGPSDNVNVPPYMNAQCQWEMLVTGAVRWYLGSYFGGRDFRLYSIWRDQALLDRMLPKAYQFWQKRLDPAGPQTRPTDEGWDRNVSKPRARRATRAELVAAPIPRPT